MSLEELCDKHIKQPKRAIMDEKRENWRKTRQALHVLSMECGTHWTWHTQLHCLFVRSCPAVWECHCLTSMAGKCDKTSGHNLAVLQPIEIKEVSLESSMCTIFGYFAVVLGWNFPLTLCSLNPEVGRLFEWPSVWIFKESERTLKPV